MEAAAVFPRRREVELPLAPDNRADFMREAADVHRALFPGNEELYGDNVRGKIESCLRVSDSDVAASERERVEYRDWFTDRNPPLPKKVFATRGNSRVRVSIEDWSINE